MSLEITGKLILKLPMQSGTSASTGKHWQKQQFVIETVEQYPRKICSMLWGDKTDQLNQFNIGDMMKISFDVESREYQGKWYTDVKTPLPAPHRTLPTHPLRPNQWAHPPTSWLPRTLLQTTA